MASTGLIRAAMLAGYKEERILVNIINPIGSKIILNETLEIGRASCRERV